MTRKDIEDEISKADWSAAGQDQQRIIIGMFHALRRYLTTEDVIAIEKILQLHLDIKREELWKLLVAQDAQRAKELHYIHVRLKVKLATTTKPQMYGPVLSPGTQLYPRYGWIGRFMYEWCKDMESPDSFLFWAGVAALSAVTRRKIKFYFSGRELFGNHYIIFVSKPGRARKGPPIGAAEHFARTVPDVNILARTTTERLPHDLAYRFFDDNGTQRRIEADANGFVCAEELASFLGDSTYNKEISNHLLDWWDSPTRREFKSFKHNIVPLNNVHLTILGATTPGLMENVLPRTFVSGGMFSRCVIVHEERTKKRNVWGAIHEDALDRELTDQLAFIDTRNGVFTPSTLGDKWMRDWYDRHRDEIEGTNDERALVIERKQSFVIKLAMILAMSENRDFELDESLFQRASDIINALDLRAAALVEALQVRPEGRKQHRVLNIISMSNPHVTRAELMRAMSPYGVSGPELDSLLESLLEQESIVTSRIKSSTKYTTVYSLKGIKP